MHEGRRKTYREQLTDAFTTNEETQEAYLSQLSTKRQNYVIYLQGLHGEKSRPRFEAAEEAGITRNNISNSERSILHKLNLLTPEVVEVTHDRFLSGEPEEKTKYFTRIMDMFEQTDENEHEKLLQQLTPGQEKIIRSRAGLDGHEPRSRAETALDTGIHQSSIIFFEYGAYRKLFKPNDRKRPGE